MGKNRGGRIHRLAWSLMKMQALPPNLPSISSRMSAAIFFLWLFSTPFAATADAAPPSADAKGFFLNCGSTEAVEVGEIKYIPDGSYISPENTKTAVINEPNILPMLTSVRNFPERGAKKKCYNFPVNKGVKHLVKTIHYYGKFDGGNSPPVFDLIIEGSKWRTVNTSDDYSKGMASSFEIIYMASDATLSVCLAYNQHTVSSPFISALHVVPMDSSLYNATDFSKYALVTIARHNFEPDGDTIGFPDDKFDRQWHPFTDSHPVVSSHSNVIGSDFWNRPPAQVFQSAITASRGQALQIKWPPFPLPHRSYYIALYFQDPRTPSSYSWRVFDVDINGQKFFRSLNVTHRGVMIYSNFWPLSGDTKVLLTPKNDAPVGPLINAAEILQLMALDDKTVPSDVMAMEEFLGTIQGHPADWSGDPCSPASYRWTGVNCTHDARTRVASLNLTNLHLSGTLPQSLSSLTALKHLWLGGNNLSGHIPDLSQLSNLETLHLENNHFEGPIPESLGRLLNLREVFLYNNNFTTDLPASLANRHDILIKA